MGGVQQLDCVCNVTPVFVQAYIDNLKATGQCEDGVICGLDGTAWTGGLALTAEEGAAIGETHSTCYSTPLRFCVGS